MTARPLCSVALAALLAGPAHATGLPPHDTVTVLEGACGAPGLRITYARITGHCVPRPPPEPSCTRWVDAELPADGLTLWRSDCAAPMPGRFVPAGQCEGQAVWAWEGRRDPGHAHTVGLDASGGLVALAGVPAAGPPAEAAACPDPGPVHGRRQTTVVARPASTPQWLSFPAAGTTVEEDAQGARLVWRPGPALQGWVLGDPDAVLASAPLPRAEAAALLAGALHTPTGLAVRHQVQASREWHEGWIQRGVLHCERVMELELEQRLRSADPAAPLGPPMVATVRQRSPAPAAACAVAGD